MEGSKVVEFKREGWRDAIVTLENIVERLKSGELPEIVIGAMVIYDVNDDLEVFGFGKNAEALQVLAMLSLGQVRVQDAILGE